MKIHHSLGDGEGITVDLAASDDDRLRGRSHRYWRADPNCETCHGVGVVQCDCVGVPEQHGTDVAAISAALRAEANTAARPRQAQRLNDLADLVDEWVVEPCDDAACPGMRHAMRHSHATRRPA